MSALTGFGLDIAAIVVLVFGLYFPRHRRRDLVVSYLGVNIGVLAVAEALTSARVDAAGLGFGLFGVLSIIRLRSAELDQQEVAYYFVAIALVSTGKVQVADLVSAVVGLEDLDQAMRRNGDPDVMKIVIRI